MLSTSAAPPLAPSGSGATPAIACRLCGAEAPRVGHQRVLRHDVSYYACPHCDLLQTEAPYWLDEAYSSALTLLDVGVALRGQITVALTHALIRVLGIRYDAPCLDFGGGHGLFVRMMRDRGYDFRWADRYAQNDFARGFEGDPTARHELLTTFEVFEHLADVGGELERIFAPRHRYVLASTVLHQGYHDDWFYLIPETGQHVAFYSARTMRAIAERFGYSVIVGPEFSLFIHESERLDERFARRRFGRVRQSLLPRLIADPSLAFWLLSPLAEPVRIRRGGETRLHSDTVLMRERLRTEQGAAAAPFVKP